MRTVALVLAALAAVAVAPSDPQKIVFARVFPNAGQIGLFIAAADGSDERPLPDASDIDYDPVWSPDGASIVFTSDREGSADLFRVKPDGTGLERLTDDPAYDDQAAFSPDGKQLAFGSLNTCAAMSESAGGRVALKLEIALPCVGAGVDLEREDVARPAVLHHLTGVPEPIGRGARLLDRRDVVVPA